MKVSSIIHKYEGQSLLEVVLVAALVSISLMSIIVMGNVSVRRSNQTIQRADSTNLATEGIEQIQFLSEAPFCGFDLLFDGDEVCYVPPNTPGSESTCSGNVGKISCNSENIEQDIVYNGFNYTRVIKLTPFDQNSNGSTSDDDGFAQITVTVASDSGISTELTSVLVKR